MKSLAALLLLLVAALAIATSLQHTFFVPLDPSQAQQPDVVAMHWWFGLRSLVLTTAMYAALAVFVALLYRFSVHVGGWRVEAPGWGRITWRNSIARAQLAAVLVALVLLLPSIVDMWQTVDAWRNYLAGPIVATGWAAATEYLWRIACALEDPRFVASTAPARSHFAWRSRVAIGLAVLALLYYVASAPFYWALTTKTGFQSGVVYSPATMFAGWLLEPLHLVGMAGCIEYLLRIAKALPEGKVLMHEPSA